MKKILNICILLLSLIACSNNVASNSTCPCENLIKENNTKYSIFDITGLTKDDIFRVTTVKKENQPIYEIKEEDFAKFFNFIDREYTMTNFKYINDNFIKYKKEEIVWVMLENENYGISFNQIFIENGDSYLLMNDADPYISSLITKDEHSNFLNSIGY
jgi:hypothetical protein